MNITYNKQRHIELLKVSQDLKNQGKALFRENPAEDFELSKYNAAVVEHILWQDRYQFGLLMENFLKRKIDGEEFCDRVFVIHDKLIDTCEKFKLELISGSEKIKAFQPDNRSENIGYFLTSLYCECDSCDDDYENDELYTFIKKRFLDFQKALNPE